MRDKNGILRTYGGWAGKHRRPGWWAATQTGNMAENNISERSFPGKSWVFWVQ